MFYLLHLWHDGCLSLAHEHAPIKAITKEMTMSTTIKVDYENNNTDGAFFEACTKLDYRTWREPLQEAVKALRHLGHRDDTFGEVEDEVETTATPEQILTVASTLPGWTAEDAPDYAPHPIMIQQGD
jgi:hypothetical protein